MRERKRHRQTDREIETEREIERDRQRERQTDRERDRERQRETERDRERRTEREGEKYDFGQIPSTTKRNPLLTWFCQFRTNSNQVRFVPTFDRHRLRFFVVLGSENKFNEATVLKRDLFRDTKSGKTKEETGIGFSVKSVRPELKFCRRIGNKKKGSEKKFVEASLRTTNGDADTHESLEGVLLAGAEEGPEGRLRVRARSPNPIKSFRAERVLGQVRRVLGAVGHLGHRHRGRHPHHLLRTHHLSP